MTEPRPEVTEEVPPLNTSYTAQEFVPTSIVDRFRAANSLRPQSTLTINGPEATSYFIGLAIVPIILVCVLLIWMVAVCGLGCSQNRGCIKSPPVVTNKRRRFLWGFLTLLMLGSVISWACALGFSVNSHAFGSYLSDDLETVANLFGSVNSRLQNITDMLEIGQEAIENSRDTCPENDEKVQNAINELRDIIESNQASAKELLDKLMPKTIDLENAFENASNTVEYAFQIRTAIAALLSGLLLAVTFICLVFSCFAFAGKGRNLSCFFRGCCCDGCCTPLLSIVLIFIIITFLLAAVTHAITLLTVDSCAPNVNVNIDRIVGEIQSFGPFSDYNGTNVTQLCDAIDASFEGDVPIIPSAICYYQTCDTNSDFSRNFVNLVDEFYNRTMNDESEAAKIHGELVPDENVLGEACLNDIADIGGSLALVLLNSLWILYYISCENINQMYANAVYYSYCDDQITYSVSLFESWICGNVFIMAAFLFWLIYRNQLYEPSTKSEDYSDESQMPMYNKNDDLEKLEQQNGKIETTDFNIAQNNTGGPIFVGNNDTLATI